MRAIARDLAVSVATEGEQTPIRCQNTKYSAPSLVTGVAR